jgi:hypothetical protein
MLYVVQLTRRGGFPGVTVLVALNAAGRSLHATRRYLHVDPLAGPGPDESDLPASAVCLPARGGRLTLRVPLPRISRNFCCWIASVTASKPDGSAPVTYNVRPQSLGRAGRAVDLSR